MNNTERHSTAPPAIATDIVQLGYKAKVGESAYMVTLPKGMKKPLFDSSKFRLNLCPIYSLGCKRLGISLIEVLISLTAKT